MGPLLLDDGPLGARLARRGKAIALEVVLLSVVTVLMPVLLPAAALVDLVLWVVHRGKPWMATRLLLIGWYYVFSELRALALLVGVQAAALGRDSRTRRFRVYRLRQQWMGGIFDTVVRVFRLRLTVEGLDEVAPGPVVILCRHASIIDNAMPDHLVGRTHGMGLRFVLKRELQMLPAIDIGGRMVPTSFVRRGSGDTVRELEVLRRLAADPDPHEGFLIYPEGTRWTPAKLERAQEIIREKQPDVAPYADRLRWLLPPRLGGPVALLEAARGADVVLCGHVGLDGFEYIRDIWAGGLVGGEVRIRFWRFPAAEVPEDPQALRVWIYERWLEVDAWIGAQRAELGLT